MPKYLNFVGKPKKKRIKAKKGGSGSHGTRADNRWGFKYLKPAPKPTPAGK